MLTPAPRQRFLARLPNELVDQIVKGSQRVSYPAGSTIPVADERPWMAVVQSGCLRTYLMSPEGSQVTLRYVKPGDLVGAFEPGNTSRAIQSLKDSQLMHLDATRFFALVQKEPTLAWELVHEMAAVIGVTTRSVGIRSFGSIEMRVAHAILERAGACGDARRGTLVVGTQQELATAAGTVREVVAPALHGLRDEGIIEIRRGALVIIDPEKLASKADGDLGLRPAV